jgi:hypothetical protein
MQSLPKHNFWREGAFLVAIFALLLAPLAQAVSRGYFAQDAVRVASGEKPMALCMPGDTSGLLSEMAGVCCDLCLPTAAPPVAAAHLVAADDRIAARLNGLRSHLVADAGRNALPPARGPPTA